jgi:hypothetical protein
VILWPENSLSIIQWLGVACVFGGLSLEIWDKYLDEEKRKQKKRDTVVLNDDDDKKE